MKEKIIQSCLSKIRGISSKGDYPRTFLSIAFDVFSNIKKTDPTYDLVALDWAGIGDAICHSRLILQHLLPQRILWITTPTVYGLFKDDRLMDVRCGFNGERNVETPFLIDLATQTEEIMKIIFSKRCISITKNIMINFNRCSKYNFSDMFFCSCGMSRNRTIKHALSHNGEKSINTSKKYIVIEHSSLCGIPANIVSYKKLFSRIKDRYDIFLLGSLSDPVIDGAIDCRGMSLYDTFSIVRDCSIFIGRSSGNQSLMCFLPHIPLIEVDVRPKASYQECGLHPNVKKVALPEEAERYL